MELEATRTSRLFSSHEHRLFGFSCFDEFQLGFGELALEHQHQGSFSRAVLILPSLDLVQQQQQTDLVLQVHGVLQVHLGDLVFTRQTSQVEGEAEEAVEGSGSSD